MWLAASTAGARLRHQTWWRRPLEVVKLLLAADYAGHRALLKLLLVAYVVTDVSIKQPLVLCGGLRRPHDDVVHR
jgi:hypothetical protein